MFVARFIYFQDFSPSTVFIYPCVQLALVTVVTSIVIKSVHLICKQSAICFMNNSQHLQRNQQMIYQIQKYNMSVTYIMPVTTRPSLSLFHRLHLRSLPHQCPTILSVAGAINAFAVQRSLLVRECRVQYGLKMHVNWCLFLGW